MSVFEVDLQFLAGVPVVSHYLPLLGWLPRLRHDRWRFTLRARARAEEDLDAVVGRVPAGAGVLVDLKGGTAADVVALLRASARPPEGWYVSGKDPEVLAEVAAAGYRTWLSVATRPADQPFSGTASCRPDTRGARSPRSWPRRGWRC